MRISNDLEISNYYPKTGSRNIKINEKINVYTSKELNKGSIKANFIVLKNTHSEINSISDLKKDNYKIIKGDLYYNNRSITFTPSESLEFNSRYTVIVRNQLTDINGSKLFRDHVFYFYTEGEFDISERDIPKIIFPQTNSIIENLDRVEVDKTYNNPLIVQISNTNDFTKLAFSTEVDTNTAMLDKKLVDGEYYIRTKTTKSEWSEVVQVYVQEINENPFNITDDFDSIDSFIEGSEDVEEEITINIKPDKKFYINNNKIHVVINKLLDMESLYIEMNSIYDVLIDEEEFNEVKIKSYTVNLIEEINETHIVIEI